MIARFRSAHHARFAAAGAVVAVFVALSSATQASAATTIDGPIDLGAATGFSVLGASAVTNTGPSIIPADLGVSPGTSITGFPPGVINGTPHPTDAVAASAQADTTTAYNVAASLTPTTSGLTDLVGLTLTPGVYSGGELSLSGDLTLDGSASSVWVFQAASTLITASGSNILLINGADICNVFWQVGSSATLGSGSSFVGTILAAQAITANTSATIAGRLLARETAVTLDSNVITEPTGCADASTTVVSASPTITSGEPTDGTVDTPYSFTVTSTGSTARTYSVLSGVLPTGLALDAATGEIAGTPTTAGDYTFTVAAANSIAPAASTSYTVGIRALELAATGPSDAPLIAAAAAGLLLAGLLALSSRRPERRRRIRA